ncbi:hypothetical protein AVEN_160472-1 [Araneus ventricosus]|uniref:Uncharacterized protein n=1 Tax=Araneus ventricosus TaxID=182803 RepID=A0A4Y2PKG8_ARAVE|nr:hypothetical protein AVEN_160472-1 [Araneus ventricosus]
MAWDDGDTGGIIHNIISKVSLQQINWTRSEVLLLIRHGLFPSHIHRFNLAETSFCSCGRIYLFIIEHDKLLVRHKCITRGELLEEYSTPIHYATACLITASYHMAPPRQRHKPVWFRRVAINNVKKEDSQFAPSSQK